MNIRELIIDELKDLGIKNYGLIRKDGLFYETNLNETAKKIMSKIVIENRELPVNNYIKRSFKNSSQVLYIYKVAYNGFIICISSMNPNIILNKLAQITNEYGFLLYKLFSSQKIEPLTKKAPLYEVSEPISAIFISKNKGYVPEPIAWIPSSFNEKEVLKISTKALLILLGEIDEIRDSYSIIHFIDRKSIGLIYVFEIPNRKKLSSATLTILFNENIKKIILINIEDFESEIKSFINRNRNNFNFSNENIKILHDKIISIFNKISEEKIPEVQIKKMDSNTDLKDFMIKEIKKIKMPEKIPKKVEKKLDKLDLKSEMISVIKKVKNQD